MTSTPFLAAPTPAHKLLAAVFDRVLLLLLQGSLEERLESAGGVSSSIVDAFRAVLQDSSLDGAFVSAAITLPASTELRDDIPHMNPVLLYQVRCACKHLPCMHSSSQVPGAGLPSATSRQSVYAFLCAVDPVLYTSLTSCCT